MNQVVVSVRVRGVLKREGEGWVAGFPRLDVYSQGDTIEEAKANASDALRLWVDSCLDRGTLGEALRDLGWHRYPDDRPGWSGRHWSHGAICRQLGVKKSDLQGLVD
ncbi:MAG TPA: type II toxin-antitoxin system HicB family antitoxin [Thermoanaerobaculia bacterium]|nr:type II toxin-antitoxin system HicB family antitoxin [Thermoanaerobaculia bacterium]